MIEDMDELEKKKKTKKKETKKKVILTSDVKFKVPQEAGRFCTIDGEIFFCFPRTPGSEIQAPHDM